MLVNNFLKYLYTCSNAGGTRSNRTCKIKGLDGATYTTPDVTASNRTNSWLQYFTDAPAGNAGDFWLILGSDNTAVTKDDYKLGNEITELTAQVGDYIYSETTERGTIRVFRTYANNTDHDIDVSEVGLVVNMITNDHIEGQKSHATLIAREVFDPKIVVKSGGGTDVRRRHWLDTTLSSLLHNIFCSSPACKEVAA